MVDSCLSNPCQHGGTCKTEEGGFVCTCTVNYRGTFCNGKLEVMAQKTQVLEVRSHKNTKITMRHVEQSFIFYSVISRHISLFIAYFPFNVLEQRGSHAIQTLATMEESAFLLLMDLFADVPRDIEEKHVQVCLWF